MRSKKTSPYSDPNPGLHQTLSSLFPIQFPYQAFQQILTYAHSSKTDAIPLCGHAKAYQKICQEIQVKIKVTDLRCQTESKIKTPYVWINLQNDTRSSCMLFKHCDVTRVCISLTLTSQVTLYTFCRIITIQMSSNYLYQREEHTSFRAQCSNDNSSGYPFSPYIHSLAL